jgi:hypothetical protein
MEKESVAPVLTLSSCNRNGDAFTSFTSSPLIGEGLTMVRMDWSPVAAYMATVVDCSKVRMLSTRFSPGKISSTTGTAGPEEVSMTKVAKKVPPKKKKRVKGKKARKENFFPLALSKQVTRLR